MNSISFNTISRSIKRKVKGGEKQARRRGKKERQEGRKRVASQIKASLRAALRYLSQTLFTFFLCHRPNDNLCQQRALKGHCKASFFFFLPRKAQLWSTQTFWQVSLHLAGSLMDQLCSPLL